MYFDYNIKLFKKQQLISGRKYFKDWRKGRIFVLLGLTISAYKEMGIYSHFKLFSLSFFS